MDERIKRFSDELRGCMSGMPQNETDDAVLYYEEYLSDALEAGNDLDAMIANLDKPQQIAAAIRTESSISKARQNPGIRSFSRVLSSAFKAVSTPFAVFWLLLSFIPSVILVGVFFIAAFSLVLAAVIFAFGMIYQAAAAAPSTAGLLGSLGLGLFAAGILALTAYAFYKLARLMIRLSALMIRRITKKPGRYMPESVPDAAPRKPRRRFAVIYLYLLVTAAGLIMLSVSGLPLKYFTIFNSMEQKYASVKTETFKPADIDRLSISTTHTDIRLRPGNTDAITVAYQQVDWLDYDIGLNGKTLYFTEESNDTLPLFQLAQMHRNSAELTITIPIDFKPFAIDLESYGGFIYIDGVSSDIDVKTTTGSIFIKPNAAAPANIEATTENGRLETDPLNGTPIGTKTAKGREYAENNGSDDTIEAYSSSGGIYISRISQ